MRAAQEGAHTAWRWAWLIGITSALCLGLSALQLSAAAFIGPLAAAIVLAAMDRGVQVPRSAYAAAQAVVGLMIARSVRPSILHEIGQRWPIFAAAVVSVIAAACGIGYLLARWRVLPGTAAIWGSFPGAASAMTLMAEAYGADVRLVAFMQYLRVVIVALVASAVAHGLALQTIGPHGHNVSPLDWPAFAASLALAAGAGTAGHVTKIPAGPLTIPMLVGTAAQAAGLVKIELPPALLAVAYALIGWSIGLRFNRAILVHVARALPRVVGAILLLIALCGGLAAALAEWGGVDPLTAYLAMSPGGADTVAIIAAGARQVDLPFVMALQMSRFVVVLLFGSRLARMLVARTGVAQKARISPGE